MVSYVSCGYLVHTQEQILSGVADVLGLICCLGQNDYKINTRKSLQ